MTYLVTLLNREGRITHVVAQGFASADRLARSAMPGNRRVGIVRPGVPWSYSYELRRGVVVRTKVAVLA